MTTVKQSNSQTLNVVTLYIFNPLNSFSLLSLFSDLHMQLEAASYQANAC